MKRTVRDKARTNMMKKRVTKTSEVTGTRAC